MIGNNDEAVPRGETVGRTRPLGFSRIDFVLGRARVIATFSRCQSTSLPELRGWKRIRCRGFTVFDVA